MHDYRLVFTSFDDKNEGISIKADNGIEAEKIAFNRYIEDRNIRKYKVFYLNSDLELDLIASHYTNGY